MGSEGSVGVDAAMAEQVDLDGERKREILALERALADLDHFEVLGLRPGASNAEVKKAYHEASRRYHPDRFFGKNLGTFRARVERIFKRIHESYAVLSDADRRAAYEREHPELGASSLNGGRFAPDDARAAERRARLARHPYVAKLTRVHELVDSARRSVSSADFGKAYTDLHLASQLDPRNQDVHELLTQVRHRHEQERAAQELKRGEHAEQAGDRAIALKSYLSAANLDQKSALAASSAAKILAQTGQDLKQARSLAQRAVDLEPNSAEHRFLLARILEQAGMGKLASRQMEEAKKLSPNHPLAKKPEKNSRWRF